MEEGPALGPRRRAAGWVFAVGGVTALTALLVPYRDGPTPTFQSMLYLAVVVACALLGGRWPALAASAMGFLALNYYFTAPLHTLDVTSRLSVVTLATFVLVSVASQPSWTRPRGVGSSLRGREPRHSRWVC